MIHRGSCICGAVRFEVTGPLDPIIGCHCEQCRKGGGHFTVATGAPIGAITVHGNPRWYEYSPGVERGFCATCGSQMFWRGKDRSRMSLHMGAFDTDTGLLLSAHIYVAEKGAFYELEDDLPQFDQGDASGQTTGRPT